jgi:hypothetical protein
MPSDPSDDVVAEMLKKDARNSALRFARIGLGELLPKRYVILVTRRRQTNLQDQPVKLQSQIYDSFATYSRRQKVIMLPCEERQNKVTAANEVVEKRVTEGEKGRLDGRDRVMERVKGIAKDQHHHATGKVTDTTETGVVREAVEQKNKSHGGIESDREV